MPGEVGALGEVLAEQAVGVLVGPALPGAVRVAEVDARGRCRCAAERVGPSRRPGPRSAIGAAARAGVVIEAAIASRTASAPCPVSAGPFFARGWSPWPSMRGRCSSIVKRVVRSTSVPIAELSRPRIRSPSQWPGTARSAASAGRSLIMISGVTNFLPRPWVRARGTRSARPVRKQATSSRRSAPRPWTYSAW